MPDEIHILRQRVAELEQQLSERNSEVVRTFDAVLAHVHEFVYLFDREGRFRYVNKPLLDLWGLTLEQALGRNFAELGYPDELVRLHDSQLRRVIETGLPVDGENAYTSPAGVTGWYEYTFVPLFGADGSVESVGGHTRDVTRQRQTNDALRTSEAKYRTLFESIDEGFCIIEVLFGPDGQASDYRFLEINPAFEKQTGFTAAVGKTVREFVPDLEEHWFEIYGEVARTGSPVRVENEAKDLGRFYDVYACRIGKPEDRHVAVLFNDISDRKRHEATLAFLADLSDDFSRLSSAEEIMQIVGRKTGAYLQVTTCNFAEVDEPRDQLTVTNSWNNGGVPDLVRTSRIPDILDEEYRRASRAGETVVVRDTQTDPRTNAAAYAALGIFSFIAVPFHRDGEWKYHLSVTDRKPREWRDDEVELFEEVANRVFPRLERARAEQALRENEQRSRQALDIDTVGVIFFDLDGNIHHANDAFLRMSGYTREDLQRGPLRWDRLTPEEWLPVTRQTAAQLAATGRAAPYEKEYLRPDGSRWSGLFAPRMLDDREAVEFILDVTERKRAEEALRESEERFRAIVSQATAGIAQVDLSGRFTLVNDRYCEIVARSREELYSLRMQDITHPEDLPGNIPLFRRAIESGEPFVIEKRYVCPDGSHVWVVNSVSLVRDANGHPQSIIAITHDISERKQAEEALRRSNQELARVNKELEEFAYVASHDLQEPIRMVNIYTQQLLRRFVPDHPDALKYAGFIEQGVNRLQELVRDLLDFSRTVHVDGLPVVGTADLSCSLTEALNVLQRRIEENRASIFADPLPLVRGDSRQLAHVLQNLIGNSLKYRKPDVSPEIRITANRSEDNWIIAVSDNGIGFDQQYAQRIFGLFKRLHKDEYPGTGLGLAICQRIVERYGGRMWAEGRLGHGATFSFSLPAAEAQVH